jgi:hypothetical protein
LCVALWLGAAWSENVKLKHLLQTLAVSRIISGTLMSHPVDHTATPSSDTAHDVDVVEQIAHVAPMILPIVGGVLIFLLAFIAVFMA